MRTMIRFFATCTIACVLNACGADDHKRQEDVGLPSAADAPLSAVSDLQTSINAAYAVVGFIGGNQTLGADISVDYDALIDELLLMSGAKVTSDRGIGALNNSGSVLPALIGTLHQLNNLEASARTQSAASGQTAAVARRTLYCNGVDDTQGEILLDLADAKHQGTTRIDYVNCRKQIGSQYEITNGVLLWRASGTATAYGATLTSGDGDIEPEDTDLVVSHYDGSDVLQYQTIFSTSTAISYRVSTTGNIVRFTINGRERYTHALQEYVRETAYDHLAVTAVTDYSQLRSVDMTLNGALESFRDNLPTDGIRESEEYLGYVSYRYVSTIDATDTTLANVSISGKQVFTHQGSRCQDGAFQISTLTPLQRVNDVLTNQGTLRINNSAQVAVIGLDTLRVTAPGGDIFDAAENTLRSACAVIQ